MSEIEAQSQFREDVRADLAEEKAALADLSERVTRLEQTVVHGNGHPALTVQVKELETKVDNLSREVGFLREEVGKIGELNTNVIEIKAQLAVKKESNGYMIAFIISLFTALVTVVGTAAVQAIFK